MFQGEIVRVSPGPARNHVVAAVVATVLSIALHMGLLALLPSIRFGLPMVPREYRAESEFRALHLRDVERPEKVQPPEGTRQPDAMTAPVDLAEVVKELGLQPSEVAIEPPPVTDERLAGEAEPIVESAVPAQPAEVWESRQDILEIDQTLAAAKLLDLNRSSIPKIERVERAPDVVIPVDREFARISEAAPPVDLPAVRPSAAEIEVAGEGMGAGALRGDSGVVIGEAAAETAGEPMTEAPSDITPYKPIEDLLRAKVTTYSTLRDFRHGYFRIEIERVGARLLPVIPKDVVFVQDCSASMSEQRMYFCREGLTNCLAALAPHDRFNVVGFRDRADFCFPGWVENTPEARQKAIRFIQGLTAGGNTDIYSSMKDLMTLEQTPGRPVIAVMISDGMPTRGLVDSSDIIGEFTKLNDGRISVFSMGTSMTANTYLLDLLSYCNRGDASLVKGGRWGIPEYLMSRVQAIRRPVLSGVRFQFAGGGDVEVYPVLTSNLYLDKALLLYGRYPRGTKDLVFQVVGQAADTKCDMIFSLALDDDAATGDKEIREMWAKQKLYHLIGAYARTPEESLLEEIRRTSRSYDVPVPHRGWF